MINHWLSIIANPATRRVGKTRAMAEAAKSLKALLIVHNSIEAGRVQTEHGCSAASYDRPERFRGLSQPILFDPDAIPYMLRAAYTEGRREGFGEGFDKGYDKGHAEGRLSGVIEGKIKGFSEAVIRFNTRLRELSQKSFFNNVYWVKMHDVADVLRNESAKYGCSPSPLKDLEVVK